MVSWLVRSVWRRRAQGGERPSRIAFRKASAASSTSRRRLRGATTGVIASASRRRAGFCIQDPVSQEHTTLTHSDSAGRCYPAPTQTGSAPQLQGGEAAALVAPPRVRYRLEPGAAGVDVHAATAGVVAAEEQASGRKFVARLATTA